MANARRRVLLIKEPIGREPPKATAEKLAAIGEVLGDIKIDEIVDAAYIALDTAASDYAIRGIARGWRIWHPRRRH